MAAAFGLLRLSPKNFWSMTPREMERAMSVLGGARERAPGRGELAEMMMRFPDGRGARRDDPRNSGS